MSDPAVWLALLRSFRNQLLMEGLRYAVVALLLWVLLHVALRRRLAHRVIAGWPQRADLRREVAYSVSSLLIFAGLGALIFGLARSAPRQHLPAARPVRLDLARLEPARAALVA